MIIKVSHGNKHYVLEIDETSWKSREIEYLFIKALNNIETEKAELSQQLRDQLLIIANLKTNLPPQYWYLFRGVKP